MTNFHSISDIISNQSSEEIATKIANQYYSEEVLPIALEELKKRGVEVNQTLNLKSDYVNNPMVSYKPLLLKSLSLIVIFILISIPAITSSLLKESLFGVKDEVNDLSFSQAVADIKSTLPYQLGLGVNISRLVLGEGREIIFHTTVSNNIDENKFKSTIEDLVYSEFCKGENVLLKYKIGAKWLFEKDNKLIKTVAIPAGECREQVKP